MKQTAYAVTCPECGAQVLAEYVYLGPGDWMGGVASCFCPCGYTILSETEGNPVKLGGDPQPEVLETSTGDRDPLAVFAKGWIDPPKAVWIFARHYGIIVRHVAHLWVHYVHRDGLALIEETQPGPGAFRATGGKVEP